MNCWTCAQTFWPGSKRKKNLQPAADLACLYGVDILEAFHPGWKRNRAVLCALEALGERIIIRQALPVYLGLTYAHTGLSESACRAWCDTEDEGRALHERYKAERNNKTVVLPENINLDRFMF